MVSNTSCVVLFFCFSLSCEGGGGGGGGGYVFFLKIYSDFGGGKKNNMIQSFCHIT